MSRSFNVRHVIYQTVAVSVFVKRQFKEFHHLSAIIVNNPAVTY